jgi:hypothetical protein
MPTAEQVLTYFWNALAGIGLLAFVVAMALFWGWAFV